MSVTTDGLARITVDTPDRRLDIAAPDGVPLADLIRVLVRSGGDGLAQRGAATGWVVRRSDGSPLAGAQTLPEQGVRDGDVLQLVPADVQWPAIEYDDIADAIAATKRSGARWSEAATRRTGTFAGSLALLLALATIVRNSAPDAAAVVAAALCLVLLGAGTLVARTGRDHPTRATGRSGVTVAALAMPYAFVAAYLGRGEDQALLAGCLALVVAGSFAMLGVGRLAAVFVASTLVGVAGALGAVVEHFTSSPGAAAVVLGAVTLAAGAVPSAAARLGGLGRWFDTGHEADGAERDALTASIARGEAIVDGLCAGIALVATASAWVLADAGTSWSRSLVIACLVALALRARLYGSIRQRLAALAAPVGAAVPLVAIMAWTGVAPLALTGVLVVGGLVTMTTTASVGRLRVLSRTANLVEALGLLAVLPLVCGVLNLYARARHLP